MEQGIGNGESANPVIGINHVERIPEERGRNIAVPARTAIELLHNLVIARSTVEASHVIAIHEVNGRCLASGDD